MCIAKAWDSRVSFDGGSSRGGQPDRNGPPRSAVLGALGEIRKSEVFEGLGQGIVDRVVAFGGVTTAFNRVVDVLRYRLAPAEVTHEVIGVAQLSATMADETMSPMPLREVEKSVGHGGAKSFRVNVEGFVRSSKSMQKAARKVTTESRCDATEVPQGLPRFLRDDRQELPSF